MQAMTNMESVLIRGDLAAMNPEQRVMYYAKVCESLGLNPLTKPFEFITLNGKLTLYAKRDATDQLRKLNHVSVVIISRSMVNDLLVVTAQATLPDGRKDESIGAVFIGGLKGDNLANAMMKAETKAKRRVTLSICGLGLLDETEAEPIGEKYNAEPREVTAPANTTRISGQNGADRSQSVATHEHGAQRQTDTASATRGHGTPVIATIRESAPDTKSDTRAAVKGLADRQAEAILSPPSQKLNNGPLTVTLANSKEIKSGPWERDRASDAQIKRLWAKGREYGISDKQLHDLAGVEHFEELTKKSIQEVFLKVEKFDRDRSEFNPPPNREMGDDNIPF